MESTEDRPADRHTERRAEQQTERRAKGRTERRAGQHIRQHRQHTQPHTRQPAGRVVVALAGAGV
ncbi:hypothetical protein, partial [Streptomyces sp. Ru87]|uniref:hypothetical protein n=1 Tax=Streptomyces sp. Ru87 TaxID=2044307 RepID=UPI000C002895